MAFGLAVHGEKVLTGLDFEVNSQSRAKALPAAEVGAMVTLSATRWSTRPGVRERREDQPSWAESYEFTVSPGATPTLLWQRDARSASGERSHTLGRPLATLDQVATASPLAEQIVRFVGEPYPDHANAPAAAKELTPATVPSTPTPPTSPHTRRALGGV